MTARENRALIQLRWLLALIAIGLASGMLLSWKLWMSERDFPHFPVWNFLGPLPHSGDTILVGLLFALIAWLIIKPSRIAALACLLTMLWLALQDQMRWQPWFYQYALMLLPFAFFDWKKGKDNAQAMLALQQAVIICVYLWGGLHKCHVGFINVYKNSLIPHVLDTLENGFWKATLANFGYLIPPIEILLAVGLVFTRTRRWAAIAALAMHVLILILLGPAKGYISNSVIWPWNLAMMAMVVALFWNAGSSPWLAYRRSSMRLAGHVLYFLLLIAPALYYAGMWDRYLAFNLYSGRQTSLLVRVDAKSLEMLPAEWSAYYLDTQAEDGHKILSASRWAINELNAPFISEKRIIKRFAHFFCSQDTGGIEWLFYTYQPNLPQQPKQYFNCSDIDSAIK